MGSNFRTCSTVFGFYLLAASTGCVTYPGKYKVYDTRGTVYTESNKPDCFRIRRNRAETIGVIPDGRVGYLTIDVETEKGKKRKRSFLIGKGGQVRMMPDGEIWFFEDRFSGVNIPE